MLLTVPASVLEVFLARQESVWPGLILPIVAGLFALLMALNYVAPANTPWYQLLGGILLVFLVSGIPMIVLLVIFFASRGKRRRNRQLEKMNVQDL